MPTSDLPVLARKNTPVVGIVGFLLPQSPLVFCIATQHLRGTPIVRTGVTSRLAKREGVALPTTTGREGSGNLGGTHGEVKAAFVDVFWTWRGNGWVFWRNGWVMAGVFFLNPATKIRAKSRK